MSWTRTLKKCRDENLYNKWDSSCFECFSQKSRKQALLALVKIFKSDSMLYLLLSRSLRATQCFTCSCQNF